MAFLSSLLVEVEASFGMRVVDGCRLTRLFVGYGSMVDHLVLCVLTSLEVEGEVQRLTLG